MLISFICPVLRYVTYTLALFLLTFSQTPSNLTPYPPRLPITLDTVMNFLRRTLFDLPFALSVPMALKYGFKIAIPDLRDTPTSKSILYWANIYSDIGILIGTCGSRFVFSWSRPAVPDLLKCIQVSQGYLVDVTITSRRSLGRKKKLPGRIRSLWLQVVSATFSCANSHLPARTDRPYRIRRCFWSGLFVGKNACLAWSECDRARYQRVRGRKWYAASGG